MKNFLFIIFALITFSVSAQSVNPRFGIVKSDDNTGRVLTYKFNNTNDAIGADTVKLSPNAWETLVVPSATITDSLSYSLRSLSTSYTGDFLIFSFTNSTGANHKIKFVGAGWQFSSSGSSITLTTAKKARISFMFDGTVWIETGRMVQ